MAHSLVFKLTALVAVITGIAFGLIAYILFQSTSAVFVLEGEHHSPRHAPQSVQAAVTSAVRDAYARDGLRGLRALTAHPESPALPDPAAFFVLDNDLEVLASTESVFRNASVERGNDGEFLIEASETANGRRSELTLTATSPTALLDLDGNRFGYLVVLPEPLDQKAGNAFARSVWKSAALWLVPVMLLTIMVTAFVLRRFLRPIDQLTAAACKLGAGEIPEHLSTSGNAEIDGLIEAFNAATTAIGRTEQMRKQLISDIAHELRTPVTNLKAQIEAADLRLLPMDKEFLATMTAEVKQLQGLIQDFQQLAITDAGQLRLTMESVPLADFVTSIIAPVLETSGGELRSQIASDIEVWADEQRLRQVFGNLLENAIRHQRLALVVTVAASIDGESVRILFSDNGPGISAADQPHIFERFFRAERSRNRSTGGAGLGLTIVKGLLEAMHGSIRLDRSFGSGARFEILLRSGALRASR